MVSWCSRQFKFVPVFQGGRLCWGEIPPRKNPAWRNFQSLFYVHCVLRGWNFITQHRSNKWCQHSVDMCFAIRVLQPLSMREKNVRCAVRNRQLKTFIFYMSSVSVDCQKSFFFFFLRLSNVMKASASEFLYYSYKSMSLLIIKMVLWLHLRLQFTLGSFIDLILLGPLWR